jgi:hypothetical protein
MSTFETCVLNGSMFLAASYIATGDRVAWAVFTGLTWYLVAFIVSRAESRARRGKQPGKQP